MSWASATAAAKRAAVKMAVSFAIFMHSSVMQSSGQSRPSQARHKACAPKREAGEMESAAQ
jgi:hypothetical protein